MRISTIFASLALVAATGAASAQDWPNRPITMVVPLAAGGGLDMTARIQAQALGDILGQTVVVENIGGAAGTAGTSRVARAAPDGYTFLIGNSGTLVYSQALYKKPPYDSIADFVPIGLVSDSPRILLARKDLPATNLREFVAHVKSNKDKVQFGSAGVGSGTHIPCLLLNATIGVDVTHVPYRGAAPAIQDLIAGRIDYMCDTIQTGAALAKAGSVKGVAVLAPKRVPIIAELATNGEQGLPGVEATVWNGFFFPKGTPEPIVRKMNEATRKMLASPAMRAKLEELGLEIAGEDQRSPEYLAKMLREDIDKWGKVIRATGISMD